MRIAHSVRHRASKPRSNYHTAFCAQLIDVKLFAACRGGDLNRLVNKAGVRLPENVIVESILRPLLSIMSYLHGMGVAHRDIKPANLLFLESGDLKLADFGVAIDTSQERGVTRTGTETYMAPEVCSNPFSKLCVSIVLDLFY